MTRLIRAGRGILLPLICLTFTAWAVKPDLGHLPNLISVLSDHAEMVADHGHSHGFEEDLAWALHGHSHDLADHDHGTELLVQLDGAAPPGHTSEAQPTSLPRDGPTPIFRLDRPPQA